MQYEVIVELKEEVLDAEGRAITASLQRLGQNSLQDIRVSKRFVVDLNDNDGQGLTRANEIAQKYLANPVSQTYKVRKL